MTLRFASSMGEVHKGGTDNFQLLRYWNSANSVGTGSGAGLMSNLAIVDNSALLRTPVFTEQNTWICQGVFLNSAPLAGPSPMTAGLRYRRLGVEQLAMVIVPATASGSRPDGQLYSVEVRRGATLLAASAPIFYAQQFTIFQFKATIDTGVGGSFEVRAATVEGGVVGAFSNVVSGTGVNTADTGVAGADDVEIHYNVEAGSSRWDHFWVMDDQGSINNDFPGKFLLVQGVVPNAQGAQNDWTSQGGQGGGSNDYESVNDPGDNIADDVGRHTSDTTNDIFLVGYQIPGETGAVGFEDGHPISGSANVQGVIFHHVSGMENSGNRTVSPIYRNASDVRADGTNQALTSTSFNGFFEVFELNPVSAAAWTAQQTKEMEWGLKLQA